MRSQNNFQIESSNFRHFGTFKIISKSFNSAGGQTVPTEREDRTLDVWFSYLSGSGLKMGQELAEGNQDNWEMLKDNNSIVFRFQEILENMFREKEKNIKLTVGSKDYSLTKLLNVAGESIYQVAGLERIEV